MPKALILNRLFMIALRFSIALKLVSRTLGVNLLVQFPDGSKERLKGVVLIGLSGIPTQLKRALGKVGRGHGKD
jgi:hypothetical protein